MVLVGGAAFFYRVGTDLMGNRARLRRRHEEIEVMKALSREKDEQIKKLEQDLIEAGLLEKI
uniref:Uncharacterized protein n=1 Tax=Arundo donax TaxID=35708 RepID=A0A0A9BRU0_ARUDO